MRYLFVFICLLSASVANADKTYHFESQGQCIGFDTVDTFLEAFNASYGSTDFQRRYGRYEVAQLRNPPVKAKAASAQLKLARAFFKQVFEWQLLQAGERLLLLSNLSDERCVGLNAFYGKVTPTLHLIAIYDLHKSSAYSMASDLDVVAHEYGHGLFNQFHPGRNKEINAINESVADMFGSTARIWLESGKRWDNPVIRQDSFVLGRAAFTEAYRLQLSNRRYVRDMANPAAAGDADYYADVTDRQREEHSFAGVTNLAYYLMVMGGSHPRKNTGIRVEGIGVKKSIELIFYTLEHQIPFNSIPEFADAVRKAAKRIYGFDSGEFRSVDNAFQSVGLDSRFAPEPAPTPQEPVPPEPAPPVPTSQEPAQSEPIPPVPTPQEPTSQDSLITISGPVFIFILLGIVAIILGLFIRSFNRGLQLGKSSAEEIVPSADKYRVEETAVEPVVQKSHHKPEVGTTLIDTEDQLEGCGIRISAGDVVAEMNLTTQPLMIGRSANLPEALLEVLSADGFISRKHCVIWYKQASNELYIQSHSENGCIVQNNEVEGRGKVKIDFGQPVSLVIGQTSLLITPVLNQGKGR